MTSDSHECRDALRFWQLRARRPLTVEDVREIRANLTGFLQLLAEWDAGEDRRGERTFDQLVPTFNQELEP